MKLYCFVMTAFVVFFVSNLFAKPIDEQRISSIENKINQIEKTYLENNKDMADAVNKAQSLMQQSSELQGKIETNQFLIESQRKEFLTLLRELEFRIASLEQRLQLFSQQLSKALVKVAPEVAKEGELYQKSMDMAIGGNYLEAISGFDQFLKKYPKSDFAPEAMYWIAECHYEMKEHKLAIKSFQEFIDKYPKDKEVPSAILKQGNSFVELGFEEDAKVFYRKVMTDFPQSEWAEKAKQKIEQIEARLKGTPTETTQPLSSYPTKTIIEQKDSSLKEADIKPKQPIISTQKPETLPTDAKPISTVTKPTQEPTTKPINPKLPAEGF